jgi:hypothetical protein
MAFVYFLGALLAIVGVAMLVNRLTGTKAQYLENFQLEAGERELWRDTGADFATRPELGQALVMSYPRLRRHTIVWTSQRVLVAQKVLFSSKRMLTHQIFFVGQVGDASPAAAAAAQRFAGGFYGSGFQTIQARERSFGEVAGKACVIVKPSDASAGASNLAEAYVFSDQLAELRHRLAA